MGLIIPLVTFGISTRTLLAWGILAKKKAAKEHEGSRPEKAA
jgi:hypothetical protein